jgi:SOS response regulatory protein OraA/RecX
MEKSRRGLSLVLARAGFSRPVIGTVLDDLERRGLVDDRRFARLWLSSQVRARPRSLRLLRRDLLREGVAQDIVEEALVEVAREHPEPALALAAARKKLRPTGADPARLARLLAARGFAAAVVQDALRMVLGDEVSGSGGEGPWGGTIRSTMPSHEGHAEPPEVRPAMKSSPSHEGRTEPRRTRRATKDTPSHEGRSEP